MSVGKRVVLRLAYPWESGEIKCGAKRSPARGVVRCTRPALHDGPHATYRYATYRCRVFIWGACAR